MKKLSVLLLFIFINLLVLGANITGKVQVEKGEDIGVFIYVENELKYDISDERGNFFISGLERGKEYTLVFQKGDLPDHREKVFLESLNNNFEFTIPYTRRDIKYPVSGRINSKLASDIFLALNNESHGIIIKPNLTFNTRLADGEYNATIMQEGAYDRRINFNVLKREHNNIGTYNLEAIDYNTLTIRFNHRLRDGVLQLYKDNLLVHSQRLVAGSNAISIEALKKGDYDLVLKAYGKKEFKKRVNVVGNVVEDIHLEKLSHFDSLFVNINPKNIEASIKLFSGGDLITEVSGKELVIIDSLDYRKEYDIVVSSPRYEENIIRNVSAGDNINANLIRDIKGTLVKGYIYPFNSGAQVMLLDKGRILASTVVDESGYYELETEKLSSGRKMLRVKADGFEEKIINRTFNEGEILVNENIELKPLLNKLNGKVVFNNNNDLSNVLVIIEELSIWQFTNEKGEYYFKNIPEGTYNVIFKKIGYETKSERMIVRKQDSTFNKTNLNPIGKVIFRSNIPGYRLRINGQNINVNQKVYEYFSPMTTLNISASKDEYLPINTRISLTEAGEIRDVFFQFVNREEQNRLVEYKINKIENHIRNLEVVEAERQLYELSEMPTLKSYEREYLDIKSKLKNAKSILFDIDRNIKFEIEKVKQNIRVIENKRIGYLEKQRRSQKVYKESIDYLEKVILYHPYTSFRYDIHRLQGDIYIKLGMVNSSKNAYEEAEKYVNRRKEY